MEIAPKIHLLLRSAIAALALLCSVSASKAQAIAFVGPTSGASSVVGEQIAQGAKRSIIDDACDATKGREVAELLIQFGAKIIVGFPCVEALDAAADFIVSAESDAIILALGVQVDDITSRERRPNWPVFRLGPKSSDEIVVLADFIKSQWRELPFAIIDDGTLYGRQISQLVQLDVEADNLAPVFADTYRPLLDRQAGLIRRINRAGASHVFMGGGRFDASVIGIDAAELGFDLTLLGGSALLASSEDGSLVDGTLFAATDESASFSSLAAIGVAVAAGALIRAESQGISVREAMIDVPFDTPIGPIRFSEDGENNRDWFSIFEVVDGEPIKLGGQNNTQ